MHYLPFAFILLFMLLIAPLQASLAMTASALVTTWGVRFSCRMMTGVEPSHADTLTALSLAITFVMLALLGLLSTAATGSGLQLQGTMLWLVPAALLFCYIAGFSIGLKTEFITSAPLALLSGLLTSATLYGVSQVM